MFQKIFHEYQVTQLQQDYRLRSINLLALPDWNQSEAGLLQTLVGLFRKILTHPDRSQITLLLGISDISSEAADEWISQVVMHLLTEEELDIGDEEPEISLIDDLKATQLQPLLPYLSAQVALDYEDPVAIEELEKAIAAAGISPLPLM